MRSEHLAFSRRLKRIALYPPLRPLACLITSSVSISRRKTGQFSVAFYICQLMRFVARGHQNSIIPSLQAVVVQLYMMIGFSNALGLSRKETGCDLSTLWACPEKRLRMYIASICTLGMSSFPHRYPLALFFSLPFLFSFQGIVESSPSGLDSYCLRQASATTS